MLGVELYLRSYSLSLLRKVYRNGLCANERHPENEGKAKKRIGVEKLNKRFSFVNGMKTKSLLGLDENYFSLRKYFHPSVSFDGSHACCNDLSFRDVLSIEISLDEREREDLTECYEIQLTTEKDFEETIFSQAFRSQLSAIAFALI